MADNETPLTEFTPLAEFLDKVLKHGNLNAQEERVLNDLQQLVALPEQSRQQLEAISSQFSAIVGSLVWHDLADWIKDQIPSYQAGLKALAKLATQANQQDKVTAWNDLLRLHLGHWRQSFQQRKILCAFSSAVDATLDLSRDEGENLNRLLESAAKFVSVDKSALLKNAYRNYCLDRSDRRVVKSIEDAIAALMFGYENPDASLKPTLERDSQAEKWMRRFLIENSSQLAFGGGGASLNIADAVAALGCEVDVFWPFHSRKLAEASLACLGPEREKELQRCWFDQKGTWQQGPFDAAGNLHDGTGSPHPVRLSIPVSFSKDSKPIWVDSEVSVKPAGPGRVIFQFQGYRSAEFFENPEAPAGKWDSPNQFCCWHWQAKSAEAQFEYPDSTSMNGVVNKKYHRVILSGFQRDDPSKCQEERDALIEKLATQCAGLPVHHEISATFDSCEQVKRYSWILGKVFRRAQPKTAGMNTEELRAFTSWPGTDVYAALSSPWPESLVQRMLRAAKVRQVFDLDWMYVHGLELDMAVIKGPASHMACLELRQAMLLAKVAVFSALHVRSRKTTVANSFEPCLAPKGFLALCRFAEELSRLFAKPGSEGKFFQNILGNGYIEKLQVPQEKEEVGLVAVPVYWPPPLEGMSVTGAGDICSGIVAVLAPNR